MKSRRGFTLLEVMVATTVMGIAIVTLLSALSTSVRNATRLTDYDRAVLLARAKMDSLLADPALPHQTVMEQTLDPVLLGGAQGGWRAQVVPFEQGPGGRPGLDRVQLEIWWMSGKQRRSFGLEGFRRGLPPQAP
jgi:general secretion pathway protein I